MNSTDREFEMKKIGSLYPFVYLKFDSDHDHELAMKTIEKETKEIELKQLEKEIEIKKIGI